MAFKLKTGKTINKVLAGMGVATVASIAIGAVAPQLAGTNMGRAIEGIGAYAVGGVESLAGAAAALFLGQRTRPFTGPSSMVNVETESL